jgi:hypothetical protein
MSVFTLLQFLAYFLLILIAIILLVIIFPIHLSTLSRADGLNYWAEIDLSAILGVIHSTINFDSLGGSFKLLVASFPIYTTNWVNEEQKPGKPEDEKKQRSRRRFWKLFDPIMKLLKSILSQINVHQLDLNITAGLSDPYFCGLVFGIIYPITEIVRMYLPKGSISITPVFIEERFYGKLVAGISFRMILLIVPFLRFFLSKEFREFRRK